MGDFNRLVDRAKEIGVWVELVAGAELIRLPGPGAVEERRAIVEMRLAHDSGRVIASELLSGIGDRDRAAAALRTRVG